VLFDARGGRVYAAAYRAWEGGLEEVIAPRATGIGEVLADPLPERVSFAGDGALAHRDRIERAGFEVLGPPAGIPTADGLIRLMGDPRWGRPLSDQAEWEPDYLRASNAERERGA
jgi:tRNA A37 threonylcarbamoyladenosine modification protein TsaB